MKKILGVLTIIVLLVSVCFYFFHKQPKNIFDEIYQETEKTYHTNNILRNIDGFKISPGWPSDDPNISHNPYFLGILFLSERSLFEGQYSKKRLLGHRIAHFAYDR